MNTATQNPSLYRAPQGSCASSYDALVSLLADDLEQPRWRHRDASNIRALTVAEVTIVRSAKPVDFNDAFVRDLDTSEWPLDRPLMLAARVQIEMEAAARHVLILDVQDEISRREQFEEWESAR